MAASSADVSSGSAEFMTPPRPVSAGAPAGGVEPGSGAVASYLVRYFAAAWAAAGVEEETLQLSAPATVANVLTAAVTRHGAELERVLGRCSFLRNSVAVHDMSTVLEDGDTLDVLPPFAGG